MRPETSGTLEESATTGTATQEPVGQARRFQLENDEAEPKTALQPDLIEFLAAFAVGAAVGAGLLLLLRPRRRRGTERIRHDLAPFGKQVRENVRTARRNFSAGADATSAAVEALGQAGRTLVQGLREEVGEIVISAREELARAVDDQVGQARVMMRRVNRRKARR